MLVMGVVTALVAGICVLAARAHPLLAAERLRSCEGRLAACTSD